MPKNITTNDEAEDYIDPKEETQVDQIKKTYVLLTNHWNTLDVNLNTNYKTLIRYIAAFRNKNINKLETPYPVDYPPWIPGNIRILYQVTGINEEDFIKDVLTIRGHAGYIDTYLADKAPYILQNLIVRWFMVNNMTKELAVMEYFVGYSYYWSVFIKYFKKYKPKLEVMKFTINEMSYKNRLKSLGSVDKWLYDGVQSSYNTYDERIRRASDWELLYISDKIRSKFDSYMRNIYRAQEKNEKAKNYIFTSENSVGEMVIDNTYGVSDILAIADTHTAHFFSNPISEKAIQGALTPGGITERDLRNTILLLADNKDNLPDVRRFYQSLFQLFLDNSKYKPNDIGTMRFYIEMESLYKPGNSNDPNKNFIKEALDKWLTIGSKAYKASNRTATLNKFRKSIYEYFILKIMQDH